MPRPPTSRQLSHFIRLDCSKPQRVSDQLNGPAGCELKTLWRWDAIHLSRHRIPFESILPRLGSVAFVFERYYVPLNTRFSSGLSLESAVAHLSSLLGWALSSRQITQSRTRWDCARNLSLGPRFCFEKHTTPGPAWGDPSLVFIKNVNCVSVRPGYRWPHIPRPDDASVIGTRFRALLQYPWPFFLLSLFTTAIPMDLHIFQ